MERFGDVVVADLVVEIVLLDRLELRFEQFNLGLGRVQNDRDWDLRRVESLWKLFSLIWNEIKRDNTKIRTIRTGRIPKSSDIFRYLTPGEVRKLLERSLRPVPRRPVLGFDCLPDR